MASGVNKVILLGNLVADPEMKYTPNGTAVCSIRLATDESFKDQSGQWQKRAEYHRVVAYGKTAENCGQYLANGRQVYIEGRLTTRSWDDQNGQKRYMTEVVAREVQFIGGGTTERHQEQRSSAGRASGGGNGYRGATGQFGGPPPSDDDIPF